MRNFTKLLRWFPLFLLLFGLFCFFYFGFYRYLNFNTLYQHRAMLAQWTNDHYFLSVALYLIIYIVAVAISIPGAVFITIAGGFLFGAWLGTLYVIFSATIGATLLFLTVKNAIGKSLTAKMGKWITKMESGFQQNAFNYLLTLRLIPLFPFWIVNIVPAVLGVKLRTFVIATFLGIIPGATIYVSIGNSLNSLFDSSNPPDLNIIFSPKFLIPLLGLALISLLPILYRKYKGNH